MKKVMAFVVLIPVAVAVWWLLSSSRAATETPDYEVIRKDGKVEIRDYPALIVATTTMSSDGMNGGFGKLFGYISGENVDQKKIAMTSPVLIAETGGQKTMSFIVPKHTTAAGVPEPREKTVSLARLEAARYVALRFPGGRSPENEKRAVLRLKEWMKEQELGGEGLPLFAYYDPPWTPLPLRRNEVMIEIQREPDRPRDH